MPFTIKNIKAFYLYFHKGKNKDEAQQLAQLVYKNIILLISSYNCVYMDSQCIIFVTFHIYHFLN